MLAHVLQDLVGCIVPGRGGGLGGYSQRVDQSLEGSSRGGVNQQRLYVAPGKQTCIHRQSNAVRGKTQTGSPVDGSGRCRSAADE